MFQDIKFSVILHMRVHTNSGVSSHTHMQTYTYTHQHTHRTSIIGKGGWEVQYAEGRGAGEKSAGGERRGREKCGMERKESNIRTGEFVENNYVF